MGYSPPGSSVCGISQSRILETLPFPSPWDRPDPGIELASPALAGEFFTTEPPRKHRDWVTMSKNIFSKSNVSLEFQRNFHFLTYKMGVVRTGDDIWQHGDYRCLVRGRESSFLRYNSGVVCGLQGLRKGYEHQVSAVHSCQHAGRKVGTSRARGPCFPGVPRYMVETDTSLRTSALAKCG